MGVVVMKVAVATVLFGCLVSSGYTRRYIIERIDASGRQVIEDGPFGGSGGSPWTDGGSLHLNGDISAIAIRSGSKVDAITVQYGDTWGPEHGGGGGGVHTYKVNPGAHIIIVQGRSGSVVDEIEFITDDGNVLGPVGGGGGSPFVSTFPGCYLSYLSGSAGSRLDSITLHYECPGLDDFKNMS